MWLICPVLCNVLKVIAAKGLHQQNVRKFLKFRSQHENEEGLL